MDRGTGFGRSGHSLGSGGPPSPPFALDSADNGLSVNTVTGRIELGNDAGLLTALLLNDREIPMAGNNFFMTDSGNLQFEVGPGARHYALGDLDNANNGVAINLLDSSNRATLSGSIGGTAGRAGLLLNFGINNYALGDVDNANNGNQIFIDDTATSSIQLANSIQNSAFVADLALGRFSMIAPGGNAVLTADFSTNNYSFGDLAPANNGTRMNIDDVAQIVSFFNDEFQVFNAAGTSTILEIQSVAGGFMIGDSVDGSFMQTDAVGNLFFGTAVDTFLSLSPTLSKYQIGDITPLANNTFFEIDDSAKTFNYHSLVAGFAEFRMEGGEMRLNKPGSNSFIQIINAGFTDGLRLDSSGNHISALSGTGSVLITPAISTTDPGSGAGLWRLGKAITAASVFDGTRYVETMIDGAVVKLAVVA